jgi:nucleotide-binding universal stress UspA family protein
MKQWTVVVATDGSPGALRAAQWVDQHFDPDSAKVTVVTVEHPVIPLLLEPAPAEAFEDTIRNAMHDARRQADEALEKTAKSLERFGPATVRLQGPPVEALIRYLEQQRPDVVVVGRHGHTAMQRLLLGSISRGVLQRSPVPVIVVEPES